MNFHRLAMCDFLIDAEQDYIKKYLSPSAHSSITYKVQLKCKTSNGPIVPIRNSQDSVAITKREGHEQRLKRIEIKRCKSINELDEC